MDKVLLYFSLKYAGNWEKIYQALDKKERISDEELEQVEQSINCDYITIINPLYPSKLKNSYKPPFVLFYKGEINLLVNYYKIIGIISDDRLSPYSLEQTKKMILAFNVEKRTILTLGEPNQFSVDPKQHIVLLNGIEKTEEVKDKLYLSETYKTSPTSDEQRLIFPIANFLFVNELSMKNKLFEITKILVGESSQLFVLPQQNGLKKVANNWLIKQGAKLVETPFDILNEF